MDDRLRPIWRRYITNAAILTAQILAERYGVDATTVRLFHLPAITVIKASFPRASIQGSFTDRDIHAGQQHVPLRALPIPGSS